MITRANQLVEVIYVNPDGTAFWSPDGVGRFYFESLEEAQEQCIFDLPIVKLSTFPLDWED